MPLIPVLRRQREVGLCELGASLVYRVSSRAGRVQRSPVSKKGEKKAFSARNGGA